MHQYWLGTECLGISFETLMKSQQCAFAARKANNLFCIDLRMGSHHLQVDCVILPQHWRGHSWSAGSSPEFPGTHGMEVS